MRHVRLAAIAIAASILGAAGCGESSSTTTGAKGTAATSTAAATTTPALTKAALIAKADAICRRVNAKIAATDARYSNSKEFQQRVSLIAGDERSGLPSLNELTPPVSMEGEWKKIVVGAETLAEETGKLGAYIKTKDATISRAQFARVDEVERQMLGITRRVGLKDCARTP